LKIYGYIHVSPQEQNVERQCAMLLDAGVLETDIYLDRQSDKEQERPQFRNMLRRLKKKDLLYVPSINQLGSSYQEILERWRVITRDMGADIAVLDMPLLDTRQDKSLQGTFLSDIILHLLAFEAENAQGDPHRNQAENRQDVVRRRQAEGIAAAKARGVRFGRPPTPLPDNFHEVRRAWRNQEMTLNHAAALCGMPKGTFYSKAVKLEKEN